MAAVGAELRDSINDEYRLEAEAEERAVATYRLRTGVCETSPWN